MPTRVDASAELPPALQRAHKLGSESALQPLNSPATGSTVTAQSPPESTELQEHSAADKQAQDARSSSGETGLQRQAEETAGQKREQTGKTGPAEPASQVNGKATQTTAAGEKRSASEESVREASVESGDDTVGDAVENDGLGHARPFIPATLAVAVENSADASAEMGKEGSEPEQEEPYEKRPPTSSAQETQDRADRGQELGSLKTHDAQGEQLLENFPTSSATEAEPALLSESIAASRSQEESEPAAMTQTKSDASTEDLDDLDIDFDASRAGVEEFEYATPEDFDYDGMDLDTDAEADRVEEQEQGTSQSGDEDESSALRESPRTTVSNGSWIPTARSQREATRRRSTPTRVLTAEKKYARKLRRSSGSNAASAGTGSEPESAQRSRNGGATQPDRSPKGRTGSAANAGKSASGASPEPSRVSRKHRPRSVAGKSTASWVNEGESTQSAALASDALSLELSDLDGETEDSDAQASSTSTRTRRQMPSDGRLRKRLRLSKGRKGKFVSRQPSSELEREEDIAFDWDLGGMQRDSAENAGTSGEDEWFGEGSGDPLDAFQGADSSGDDADEEAGGDFLGGILGLSRRGVVPGVDLDSVSSEMKKKLGSARTFADFGKGRGATLFRAETEGGRRGSAPDVQWDSRRKLQILDQADVYKQAHDTIPALDFLGTGYDLLKGNPLGDPETSLDPGYRSPVLRFEWTHGPYGVTNDLSLLQPVGGFVRPFVSCRQSEAVDEVSSMSDYQTELSVDATAGGGSWFASFSASTGYREMAKEVATKKERSYFMKTYCFRYEAGLSDSPAIAWNTTYGFERALTDLPTEFHGLDPSSTCQPFIYKMTPESPDCRQMGVPQWMELFRQFGTHVTTNLKLGGKMVHEVKVKSSDVDSLEDSGVSVAAQVSASFYFFSASAKTSTNKSNSSRNSTSDFKKNVTTRVVGGRPPKDPSDPSSIVLWSKTVEDLPMPIQIQMQPLENFMPPQFRKAYRKAAIYYGRVFGMSEAEFDSLANSTAKSVADKLREGHSVVWGGDAPGYLRCPGKEVIIGGFSLIFNFRDTTAVPDDYHMEACRPGLPVCERSSSTGNTADDSRIWAVCGPSAMLSLQQVVVEGLVNNEDPDDTLEARCPDGTEIAWGLKLAVGYGPGGAAHSFIGHCKPGETSCRMAPRPESSRHHARRFVYAACVEAGYPGLRDIRGVSSVGSIGDAQKDLPNADGEVVLDCGDESTLLLGWTLENHMREEDVRLKFLTCPPGQQTCAMKGAGVDKASPGGEEQKLRDTHALLGFGLCVPASKYNAHPQERSAPIKPQ
nr:TPA: hypothetical protein BN1204_035170 [Neospora caninum Liverpool]